MARSYAVEGVRIGQARQGIKDSAGRPMKQGELAAALGIHWGTMSRIENGKARVSLDLLERMASVLGVTREHLLGADAEAEAERVADVHARLVDAATEFASTLLEAAVAAGRTSGPSRNTKAAA